MNCSWCFALTYHDDEILDQSMDVFYGDYTHSSTLSSWSDDSDFEWFNEILLDDDDYDGHGETTGESESDGETIEEPESDDKAKTVEDKVEIIFVKTIGSQWFDFSNIRWWGLNLNVFCFNLE